MFKVNIDPYKILGVVFLVGFGFVIGRKFSPHRVERIPQPVPVPGDTLVIREMWRDTTPARFRLESSPVIFSTPLVYPYEPPWTGIIRVEREGEVLRVFTHKNLYSSFVPGHRWRLQYVGPPAGIKIVYKNRPVKFLGINLGAVWDGSNINVFLYTGVEVAGIKLVCGTGTGTKFFIGMCYRFW